MADTIKYDFWLTFGWDGRAPRATKGPPGLDVNERAMRVAVELPKSLFIRPQLSATISVAADQVAPPHIDVNAVESAIESVIGGTVILQVVEPAPSQTYPDLKEEPR